MTHRKALALEIKSLYDSISPFIEEHTSMVCPSCQSVCCIDRHAVHEACDLEFLIALGEPPPDALPKDKDTLPCRHLNYKGCGLERHQRPFRCTWYFCASLLESMPNGDTKRYRDFVVMLGRLVDARARMASV